MRVSRHPVLAIPESWKESRLSRSVQSMKIRVARRTSLRLPRRTAGIGGQPGTRPSTALQTCALEQCNSSATSVSESRSKSLSPFIKPSETRDGQGLRFPAQLTSGTAAHHPTSKSDGRQPEKNWISCSGARRREQEFHRSLHFSKCLYRSRSSQSLGFDWVARRAAELAGDFLGLFCLLGSSLHLHCVPVALRVILALVLLLAAAVS